MLECNKFEIKKNCTESVKGFVPINNPLMYCMILYTRVDDVTTNCCAVFVNTTLYRFNHTKIFYADAEALMMCVCSVLFEELDQFDICKSIIIF